MIEYNYIWNMLVQMRHFVNGDLFLSVLNDSYYFEKDFPFSHL